MIMLIANAEQLIIQSPPGAINQADVARVIMVIVIGICCYILSIQTINKNFSRSKSLIFLISILYGGLILKVCMNYFPILFQ